MSIGFWKIVIEDFPPIFRFLHTQTFADEYRWSTFHKILLRSAANGPFKGNVSRELKWRQVVSIKRFSSFVDAQSELAHLYLPFE